MRRLLLLMLAVFVLCAQLLAQTRTVTGTILDNNGQPLPGVSIKVVGEKVGTTTDSRGAFTLNVPQKGNRIEVSYVGFTTQFVVIPASGQLAVSLQQSENGTLNEVVVTGYSRQRKAEYSGAGTKVTAEKVNLVPSGSIDQILQGRSPGLLVTVGSGQPGSAARVQIRGAGSITGGSTPLYVIDGVAVEAGVFQSINPNDIESVDVLRDASATALYGNRGGAGVIVVTTKKGRVGKTQLSYSGQAGITQAGEQRFDMMNSAELLQFQEMLGSQVSNGLPGWKYSRNNPANASLPAATLTQYDKVLDSLRAINTDWSEVFQRKGSFHSHDLNLSGGAGKTRFFTSLGYYDEDGIGLRSDMTRYSFRSNVDHQTDKLTLGLNAYGGFTQRNFIEGENAINLGNSFAAAYLALPYQQLYNPDGTVAVGSGQTGANAYDRLVSASNKNNQIKTTLNIMANYQLTKNVNVGAFGGLDYRETAGERQINPGSYFARNQAFPIGPLTPSDRAGGLFTESSNRYFSYVTRGNAGYRNTFATLHEVDVQAFVELTKNNGRVFTYTGYGINPALLGTPAGITPGTTTNQWIPGVGGSRTENSFFAAFATAKYTFDKKYTLNLSLRRDGTSILPEDNRYNTFYSAGATWNVMKEGFAANWSKVNDLRLRASYGTSANADNFPLGNFGYLATYGPVNYVGAGAEQGTVPTNAGNPVARWEVIKTLNIGLDFGLLRNRLTGNVDVYNKLTDDNLVDQKLSLTSGFASQIVNAATVRNRGVEMVLNGEVIRTKDFTWSLGGNVSYNENEVTDLGQVEEFEQGTEIVKVGKPLGSHYIVKWAGVDAATGQPLYYNKDGKITNVYSDDDRVADFGTYNAPWIGGFNTSIRYKGLALEAFFTFQQGFSRFNNQDFFQLNHAFATQGFNLKDEMLTMWQKPGDVTNIQSPLYQRQFVSKDIQDASYLRFRNLVLSYNFGEKVVNSLRVLNGARIFAQAQNLYTWTNWTGFDPEDDDNIAQYEYPTPRTFTLGLSLNFK